MLICWKVTRNHDFWHFEASQKTSGPSRQKWVVWVFPGRGVDPPPPLGSRTLPPPPFASLAQADWLLFQSGWFWGSPGPSPVCAGVGWVLPFACHPRHPLCGRLATNVVRPHPPPPTPFPPLICSNFTPRTAERCASQHGPPNPAFSQPGVGSPLFVIIILIVLLAINYLLSSFNITSIPQQLFLRLIEN